MSVLQCVSSAALLFWPVFEASKKKKTPQFELISCFCWGNFQKVDDSVNISFKFPFCVSAEIASISCVGKAQKLFISHNIQIFKRRHYVAWGAIIYTHIYLKGRWLKWTQQKDVRNMVYLADSWVRGICQKTVLESSLMNTLAPTGHPRFHSWQNVLSSAHTYLNHWSNFGTSSRICISPVKKKQFIFTNPILLFSLVWIISLYLPDVCIPCGQGKCFICQNMGFNINQNIFVFLDLSVYEDIFWLEVITLILL